MDKPPPDHQVGDVVEIVYAGKWVRAEVLDAHYLVSHWRKGWSYKVRKLGRRPSGGTYPARYRSPPKIRTSPDPLTGNIFADWLEEHGEVGAAAKLRAAFPVA